MTDPQFNSSSFDPSERHDLTGVIRYVLQKFLQGVDGMLPAMVVATNRKTVSVQPLISIITTGVEIVQRPLISQIPVQWPGGGGFVFSFPLKPGDLGWIKANDRDISLFLQSIQAGNVAASPPNTSRKHSFSDAVFIPDTMSYGVTIADGDADNVVLQSYDGTTKIAMGTGVVNILAPTSMNITTPTLTVNGQIVATESITSDGLVFNTHIHSGVTTGPDDTGEPVT